MHKGRVEIREIAKSWGRLHFGIENPETPMGDKAMVL
jgi:hypothetical protein